MSLSKESLNDFIEILPDNEVDNVRELLELIILRNYQTSSDITEVIPFFKMLDTNTRDIIRKKLLTIKIKRYDLGDKIISKEDPINYLYIIKKGCVKIYKRRLDGKEKILAIYEMGCTLGEMEIFRDDVSLIFAEAFLKEVELFIIPKDIMRSLIREIPKLYEWIINIISIKLKRRSLDAELDGKNAYSIVLSKLIDLCKLMDETGSRKNILIKITHEEFSHMAGIGRSTVSTILKELKEKKLIEHKNSLITVPYLSKLESRYNQVL